MWSPQPHTAAGTRPSQRGLAHLARYLYILCEAFGALGEPSEGPGTSGPSTGPPSSLGSRDGLGSPQLAGEQAGLLVSWMLVEDMKCLGETKDSVTHGQSGSILCWSLNPVPMGHRPTVCLITGQEPELREPVLPSKLSAWCSQGDREFLPRLFLTQTCLAPNTGRRPQGHRECHLRAQLEQGTRSPCH